MVNFQFINLNYKNNSFHGIDVFILFFRIIEVLNVCKSTCMFWSMTEIDKKQFYFQARFLVFKNTHL